MTDLSPLPTEARLAVGDTAPAFTLPNQDGEPVSLAEYHGRRVILFFYPEADTPGCTTEACDFRDNAASLRESGYEVLGLSRDTPDALRRWADAQGITYPLLSDPDMTVHRAYAVWGEKKLYGKTVVGVLRSTFVVGAEGALEFAQYGVRATGHVQALRRKLKLI
ncbi:thioredoxin-dependent thiol peroxidase [Rathayibacter tritici]|uniref:thioredoxin-dependent peroxiredoxin n=1 Tax=Rathayibacter tritici TaxID=33888 RepID=A0A160KTY1_9MICO|nr:thioredoxin-dependent thiol peroxidase [Rathayibacter tritici]AND17009.1 peroxiredoxin [Rathayibacter tritici]PPF25501.1 thioredoxin-dependent thiol peroxidase [Rathayibacter tritici]PPF63846.1 thioredoxin-dependent thiol peroxidase [Rathayibacter tritici]PPG04385.1 thioredoxin-dependent thiol peroxidase [Rathayibacter tritici]PPI14744.1 thioredoxin-dependent thiol peroxidase [Rathayibacter tritici]